jgi:hypothetical protein
MLTELGTSSKLNAEWAGKIARLQHAIFDSASKGEGDQLGHRLEIWLNGCDPTVFGASAWSARRIFALFKSKSLGSEYFLELHPARALTAESDLICPCDFNSSQRPSFSFDLGGLQVEPFRLYLALLFLFDVPLCRS